MRRVITNLVCILILISCSKKKGGNSPDPVQELTADYSIKTLGATTGSIDSFNVHATMNWTLSVSPGATWLQVSTTSGNSGNTKVMLTALQTNFGVADRSATITISPSGSSSVSPFIITVTQQSKSPSLATNIATMTLSGVENDKDSLLVQANLDWTISSSVSWITASSLAGTNNAKIYVTNNTDNLTDASRTGTITVTPVGTTLVPPKVIAITQKSWYRPQGGNWVDFIASSAKTTDGGFIMAGYTTSNDNDLTGQRGSTDFWLLKTDATGKKAWQRPFGGDLDDFAYCIAVAADGGYVLAGYTESSNDDVTVNYGQQDIWVVKADVNGNKVWQKSFGGNGWERANAIMSTADGGFVVTGTTSSTDGDFAGRNDKDLFILKIDASGTKQWIKFYGGNNNDVGHGIVASQDGGYVIAGYTSSSNGDITGNPGAATCIWVVKTDASGTLVWQKIVPDQQNSFGFSITASGDGGYVVSGKVVKSNLTEDGLQNDLDVIIAKLNGDGSVAWKKTFGGGNVENATAITAAQGGGFIFAGYTWSNDGGDVSGHQGRQDVWIVKIDAAGNKVWQKTMGGAETEEATSILSLQNNMYLLTGTTSSGKYNISGVNQMHDGLILKIKD